MTRNEIHHTSPHRQQAILKSAMAFLNLVFRIYVVAAALPVLGLIILLLVDTYSYKKRSRQDVGNAQPHTST